MCMRQSLDFPNRIQSPLNYTGGKFRLLPQILPLFPANIDVLVDLFCGGGNVGINTSAERIVLNDSDKNVIRIFRLFRQYPTEQILEIIDGIIDRYGLSDSRTNGYAFYQCESARGLGTYNKEGYNRLRSELNNMKRRNDRYFFMLFTLIVFAFNNQIRFNEKREAFCRSHQKSPYRTVVQRFSENSIRWAVRTQSHLCRSPLFDNLRHLQRK